MTYGLSLDTALILVDIQQGMDDPYWGQRNNPNAESNAARLLETWRATNRPLVHIQNLSTHEYSPLHPSKAGIAIKPEVAPLDGEVVMQKSVNSAFIGTDLEQWLRDRGVTQVVIAGLTTNHCVDTTTRMAGNLGFNPILVEDAAATFDLTGPDGSHWDAAIVHAITIANLHSEFATVMSTDDLIARATSM